jgi:CubicO group peptidase (beta-lactamase class C family)
LRLLLAVLALAAVHSSSRADEIDRYLARERAIYRVPALVVGIIRGGHLVDSRAFGLANVELNIPASSQHVFEIGSISKQFTAYALLMLFEKGDIDLQAPVGRYLSELPPPWGKPTLQQLMGHISGLPDFESAFSYGVYRETPTDEEFLQRLLSLPIASLPGEKWSYSNTNYWLLARVIERVSGITYAQFMQDHVFAPLGMKSTRSALPSQILKQRASGYQLIGDRLENRDAMQPNTSRGLGDIATTLADMARWEQEQRTPRLVRPATAQLAREAGKLNDGSATEYGYGWFMEQALPLPALRHTGGTAGFTADYLRVPGRDLAIVVFANCFCAPASMAIRIARLSDSALRGPSLDLVRDADAHRTQRVMELILTATRAKSEWREEWFTEDLWRETKPYLAEVEVAYRRRGNSRSITPIGPHGVHDATRPKYRAVFERAKRVLTFEFDLTGRIKAIDAEDE